VKKMAFEYNENMRVIWYSETKDIEIVEETIKKDEQKNIDYMIYFHNIYEFAELIKTNPEFQEKLKELI
jgi:hypothetical protein